MSSTQDSVLDTEATNAKNPLSPTELPKKYTKRIDYGTSKLARTKSPNTGAMSRKIPSTAGKRFTSRDAGFTLDAEKGKDDCCTDDRDDKAGDNEDVGCCGARSSRIDGDRSSSQPVRRRGCVVFIVFLALFLDSLLLTAMVPIIPNYLREHASDHEIESSSNTTQPSFGPSTLPTLYDDETELGNNFTTKFAEDHEGKGSTLSPPTPTTTNKTHSNENTRISLLFASKTLVQVAGNMFVGPLTEKIGYTIPMFSGFVVLLFSTIAFAIGNTYEILFAARAFQGIGTALSTTSGMGLLATIFPDQTERAVAQTKAFSGLALGVFLGPPFGGILYDLYGRKEFPCLILAGMVVFEGVLQLCVMRPRVERTGIKGASLMTLLKDPYIMITAAAIAISNLCTAVLEPALPIWMYYTMNAPTWLQGVAFVPSTVSYLLFLQIFGIFASKFGCFKISQRWACTIVGMIVLAISTSLIPYCSSVLLLVGPLLVMGFGLAQVCTCMLPHIGALVDLRHEPVYGSAYAITDNAFSIAFALGPAISGPLIDTIGFTWTVRGVAVVILLFVPLVPILRNPPGKVIPEEETQLISSGSGDPQEDTVETADYFSCKLVTSST